MSGRRKTRGWPSEGGQPCSECQEDVANRDRLSKVLPKTLSSKWIAHGAQQAAAGPKVAAEMISGSDNGFITFSFALAVDGEPKEAEFLLLPAAMR